MTTETAEALAYYTQPGKMTSPGRRAALLEGLPRTVAGLAAVGHGLLIHEHVGPNYGVELTPERRATAHVRPVEEMLDLIVGLDPRPLTEARAPERRLVGNCRHFTVLMVTMLRAQGVPARARCGFGGYFGTGAFEDHWVCEYWRADEGRWALVDAQIDDLQTGLFHPDFDLTDVPRTGFVVAGDAWARCRAGQADPGTFGMTNLSEFGYWWIAGNLMRDVAALNNMEMLPWDVWGPMPAPAEEVGGDLSALFDRLAALTADPDATFAELRAAYEGDDRLRVPPTVFNPLRGQPEAV